MDEPSLHKEPLRPSDGKETMHRQQNNYPLDLLTEYSFYSIVFSMALLFESGHSQGASLCGGGRFAFQNHAFRPPVEIREIAHSIAGPFKYIRLRP